MSKTKSKSKKLKKQISVEDKKQQKKYQLIVFAVFGSSAVIVTLIVFLVNLI